GGASARPAAAAPAPAPVPAPVPAPTQSLRPAAPQRRPEPPRPSAPPQAQARTHAQAQAQAPAHAAPSAAPAAEPPPWELAGGGDVPPWEELPPDLPLIGPYDSEPEPQRAAPLRRPEPPRAAMPVPAAAAADEAFAPSPIKTPPAAAPLPPEDGTPAIFGGDWPALAASLPLKGLAQQLAYQSELARVQGRTFVLRAPVAAIAEGNAVERLAQALSDHFGEAVRVHCEVGTVSETAAAADAQARAERQRAAEAAIENDPFVQGLLREFGGQIVPGSIQPRAL
uniref:DNA polymerase III subunit gamma/tau C-terminal domain-containing protein n=1 Tax=Cupriavidus gilardii TaxID=82541 RepID=UPI000AD114CD